MSDKIHWLPTKEAESAYCGATGRDLMYSSSPEAEFVDCKRCLAIGNAKKEPHDHPPR